jgi:hypothetical protein
MRGKRADGSPPNIAEQPLPTSPGGGTEGFVSPSDPAPQWTRSMHEPMFFAYSDNRMRPIADRTLGTLAGLGDQTVLRRSATLEGVIAQLDAALRKVD